MRLSSHEHDPLAALVVRATEGDRDALEALCRELERPVYLLALRTLGDTEDALEQTQEILIKVITHLSTFRAESKVLTWVYSIATRHLVRVRSKAARRAEALAERIRAGLSITEPMSRPEGPALVLEREVRLGCTQAMLEVLTPEERVAIIVAEMLGADHRVGADVCGISEASFRKRLSRARQKLKPVLEELCGITNSANPCNCARQARAKQLAEPSSSALHMARAQLEAVRHDGPIFSMLPADAPPRELWSQLVSRLDHLGLEVEA